jgi:hypothetical protein
MASTRGATVLLIGDDDLLGRALERALIAEGFVVARSQGGWRSCPSLVVLGPCTMAQGRPAPRPGLLAGLDSLPMLVLDSGPQGRTWLLGWRGALAYLAQPFGSGQFLAAVREQLQSPGLPAASGVALIEHGPAVA